MTFDAPGHGDSPGSRLYLTDLADAVLDVAAATGPIHATISHSFGAAAVLLAYPRGGFDAARNIMIAPNVIIEDAVTRFTRAIAIPDSDRSVFERHLANHSGIALDALDLERLVANRDAGLLSSTTRSIARSRSPTASGSRPLGPRPTSTCPRASATGASCVTRP